MSMYNLINVNMDLNKCMDCGSKLYVVSENIHGDKVLNCTRCNNVVREYSTTNITQQPLHAIKTAHSGKRCVKFCDKEPTSMSARKEKKNVNK